MIFNSSKYKLLIPFLVFILVMSCRKDEQIITDSSATLEFSQDSVLFDTVFTSIGSVTKQFKIYNRNNKTIRISAVRIARGSASNFRINVDGIAGTSITDVEIPKKDSLFVFVEVTVDPNNQNNPIIISDSIVFEVNGKIQDVDLEAWGQDAYFHVPNVFPINGLPPYSIISCNDIWVNDKPHVIYGYAVVDSDCKLTIQQGAKVYMHNSAVLWVFDGGTLEVTGTHGNPVVFQGDRLEQDYADIPGQWGKIWLSSGSKDNIIDWAVLKNGSIGVQADTLGNSSNPTLRLSNTIIQNMSAASIFGQGSYVEAYNCVFANAGQYVAALTLGGTYRFNHCTFGNYWNYGSRSTPLLVINNWYEDINGGLHARDIESAYFGNCILYGNIENEIALDSAGGASFNFKFDHCLLKTNLDTSGALHYNTVYVNQDPDFTDVVKYDFNLNTNSAAINKGSTTIGALFPVDLNNVPRTTDITPDLGAYEK